MPVTCRARERMIRTMAAMTVAPRADPSPKTTPKRKRLLNEIESLKVEERSWMLSANFSSGCFFLLGIQANYNIIYL